jgi:hypothetical protein
MPQGAALSALPTPPLQETSSGTAPCAMAFYAKAMAIRYSKSKTSSSARQGRCLAAPPANTSGFEGCM